VKLQKIDERPARTVSDDIVTFCYTTVYACRYNLVR